LGGAKELLIYTIEPLLQLLVLSAWLVNRLGRRDKMQGKKAHRQAGLLFFHFLAPWHTIRLHLRTCKNFI